MHFKKKFSHRIQRFGQWLKKVLVLGRTDWRLASDQCSPPRLTPAQRVELQPKFDVNVIRPRAVSAADVQARKAAPAPDAAEQAPAAAGETAAALRSSDAPANPADREYEVRRRRKRGAKHKGISPLAAFSAQESSELRGLAGKIFGRHGE